MNAIAMMKRIGEIYYWRGDKRFYTPQLEAEGESLCEQVHALTGVNPRQAYAAGPFQALDEVYAYLAANGKARFSAAKAVQRAIGRRAEAPNGAALTPWCPNCGAPEEHPSLPGIKLILCDARCVRFFCVVCAAATSKNGGGFDENLNPLPHDPYGFPPSYPEFK